MATNGPGVANILPGVAVENGEGNRVLLITSSRRQGLSYPDRGGTYQYFLRCGVIGPMNKWSGTAPTFDRVPETLRRALRISWRGRPGVVHVDIPENVLNGTFEVADDWRREPRSYRRTEPVAVSSEQLSRAVELLMRADRAMRASTNGRNPCATDG
jgi:acetolactate synthase-1/2/3 large subunit